MPWVIKTVYEGGIVVMKADGKISFVDILRRVAETGDCNRIAYAESILIDFFDAVDDMTDFDLYLLPLFYDELHVSRNSRIAVALPGMHGKFGQYLSHEKMSRDSGYNVRLFDSVAGALEWLKMERHEIAPVISFSHLRKNPC